MTRDTAHGLKVLLATDFSASSVVARELLGSLTWPSGTDMEVVHVVPEGRDLFAALRAADHQEAKRALREVSLFTSELEGPLFEHDVFVASTVRIGDPATRIAERARSLKAGLVVVGGQPRGTPRPNPLGRVAAAVVERAPCSVLVARTNAVRRVLLADDGSQRADDATDVLTYWPLFDRAEVILATVIEFPIAAAFHYGHAPFINYRYEETLSLSGRERAMGVIARRTRQLQTPGRRVASHIREGPAAEAILALAANTSTDLIVLGASDKGRFTRFLLGSVARTILTKFDGSVLVARPIGAAFGHVRGVYVGAATKR